MSAISEAIGFKEWAFVCEALGQGVQTLILRKGGIHEGKGGFHFQHNHFWLFPTGFHAQKEQLDWSPENAESVAVPGDEERSEVQIRHKAELKKIWKVTDWEKVAALAPHHVWKEEVIRDRFVWNDETCLHVALVRVSSLTSKWTFPYERGFGGCRSWVKLPSESEPTDGLLKPSLCNEKWEQIANKIHSILE
jgi:hypothetical protein